MGKKEMLSVVDENGNEKIVKLISYFTLIDNECDYLAYTEYDNEDENVKVYIGRIEFNNDMIYLQTVETEDEIDKIKDVLIGLSNNPEEGFNYVLNNIDILLKTGYRIIKNIKNIFVLKEIFVNNIIDNYEYILNKQEEAFKHLDSNELFVELDLDNEEKVDVDVDNTKTYFDIDNELNNINDILNGIINNDDNKEEKVGTENNIDNQSDDIPNDKEIVGNNIDFNINSINAESIELPKIEESDISTGNNNDIVPIDVQIKIDLNKEKIKYLNILKNDIEQEINRLEMENIEIYNN